MEQPYFALMDLVNNGIMVPHYRSVMVFSRWAKNEARETGTLTEVVQGENGDASKGLAETK